MPRKKNNKNNSKLTSLGPLAPLGKSFMDIYSLSKQKEIDVYKTPKGGKLPKISDSEAKKLLDAYSAYKKKGRN